MIFKNIQLALRNILKNKGLLDSKRDGKMIYYSLKFEHLTEVIDCINRCSVN